MNTTPFDAMTQRHAVSGNGRCASRPPAGVAVEWPRYIPSALRMLALAAALALLLFAPSASVTSWLAADPNPDPKALLGACAAYALLLALPFVPAMEIGLLIMLVFGKWGAVGAYLATVAGLNLAYGLARTLPRVNAINHKRLPVPARRALLRVGRRCPSRLLPVAALALLLNLPGNTAIGGGGGIALLYGAGRTLSWPRFAATVAVATAVLPGLVLAGLW